MQLSPDRILALKGAASALIRAVWLRARARDLTPQRPFLSQCKAIYAASPPQVHVARSLEHHHKASQPRPLRRRTLSSWLPRSVDHATRGSLTPGNSRLCGRQCGCSRRSKNEKTFRKIPACLATTHKEIAPTTPRCQSAPIERQSDRSRSWMEHYEPNGGKPNDQQQDNDDRGENSQPSTYALVRTGLTVLALNQPPI